MTKKEKTSIYQCKECGLKYKDKKWRDKCQAWCNKHQSCNLEIIEHVIQDSSK